MISFNLLLGILISLNMMVVPEHLFLISKGSVEFVSEAPLELIKAKSDKLKGVISSKNNTFAFTVPINSFIGFNSQLQEEHFHENYLETTHFPSAIYKGKIIELIDFNVNGNYDVRSKGNFELHGVSTEQIIRCAIQIVDGELRVKSNFEIELEDYDIKIPKIVNQKIASVINISVDATFKIK